MRFSHIAKDYINYRNKKVPALYRVYNFDEERMLIHEETTTFPLDLEPEYDMQDFDVWQTVSDNKAELEELWNAARENGTAYIAFHRYYTNLAGIKTDMEVIAEVTYNEDQDSFSIYWMEKPIDHDEGLVWDNQFNITL